MPTVTLSHTHTHAGDILSHTLSYTHTGDMSNDALCIYRLLKMIGLLCKRDL